MTFRIMQHLFSCIIKERVSASWPTYYYAIYLKREKSRHQSTLSLIASSSKFRQCDPDQAEMNNSLSQTVQSWRCCTSGTWSWTSSWRNSITIITTKLLWSRENRTDIGQKIELACGIMIIFHFFQEDKVAQRSQPISTVWTMWPDHEEFRNGYVRLTFCPVIAN